MTLPIALAALFVVALFQVVAFAERPPERRGLADFTGPDDGRVRIGPFKQAQWTADGLALSASSGQRVRTWVCPNDAPAWDLFQYTRVELDVENRGRATARLRVRVENADAVDWARSSLAEAPIEPGARRSVVVYLYRRAQERDSFPELAPFVGMNGLPGGFQTHWHTLDAKDVRAIDLSATTYGAPLDLLIRSVAATHPVVPAVLRDKGDAFFPFVDRYGQYRWAEWDGKVSDDAQLAAAVQAEVADLAAHPRPASWDEWGGWRDGPQLAPGRFFRVEWVDGRWWFVNPAGHLFWSHGANSVGFDSAATTVAGRERYFADLPPRDGALAAAWSADGTRFDHLAANLRRQHGADVAARLGPLAQQRLASWGLNTIGAWSDGDVVALRRTPYTAIVHPNYATVADRVPDVFDAGFADAVRGAVTRGLGAAAGDPWCIGVFVDNELRWGADPLDLIATLLAAPPERASKRALVDHLKAALGTVEAYNAGAATTHASWDALLTARDAPTPASLAAHRAPLEAFYDAFAERYFRACGTAVRAAAPGQLYLGCRFHVQNQRLVDVASRFCDVVSFNRYEHAVDGFDGYETARPILVSEFHFGALDAGMLGTGLRSASDRHERAAKYQAYVAGARANPLIVGTHWFAFCPQSITGRGDGENFNTGFFDVCNQPLPEMRAALRASAGGIYE